MSVNGDQRLVFVLSVNVDQKSANRAKIRNASRAVVDSHRVFSVGTDFSPQQHSSAVFHVSLVTELGKFPQCGRRDVFKFRADKSPVRTGADQFPACALSQHRVDGIDKNRLARTGFTGQHIESLAEINFRAFYDCYVFNIQLT